MKSISPLIIILFVFSFSAYGQNESQPKDINEAIRFLMKDCPDSLKSAIKTHKDDTLINLISPWSSDLKAYRGISEWTGSNSDKKTEIEKYYAGFGITEGDHIAAIILISFKNYLNTGKTNHGELIKQFQQIEERWIKEDKVRFTTDSLRGFYIPKDLDDCIARIDRLLSKSAKKEIREETEEDFIVSAHFGFGRWMRNHWQLWSGSRLTRYFNGKGIYQAESISGIILTSYYRHFTGKAIDFDAQVKLDQDYWKVVTDPVKSMFPKNSGNLEFKTGFYYQSKKNGQGFVHVGTNPNNDDIWLYDYYLGWAKISEAQLSELDASLPENKEGLLMKIFEVK